MNVYAFALALGSIGLVALTLLGLHHSHDAGGHGHDGTHGNGHHGDGHHADGHHGDGHAHHSHDSSGHQQHDNGHSIARWSLFLSPRVWFSILVGFGATGLLVQPRLSGLIQLAVALIGALIFEALIIRPIWSLTSRFESDPALTLESGIMDDAEAVTGFNRQGEGLVRLDLDGQVVQLLGVLTPTERQAGVRVVAGDRLVVEAVDPARQRCTVSRREGRAPLVEPSSW